MDLFSFQIINEDEALFMIDEMEVIHAIYPYAFVDEEEEQGAIYFIYASSEISNKNPRIEFYHYLENNSNSKYCKIHDAYQYKIDNLDIALIEVPIDKEIFNSNKEFEELFSKIICEFNYPKNVYLNFGKTPQIDTLGHGAYLRLENILTNIYGAKNLNLGSSTDLIYKIEETNDEDDEKYFRLAAARAQIKFPR